MQKQNFGKNLIHFLELKLKILHKSMLKEPSQHRLFPSLLPWINYVSGKYITSR
jgi:hypothetical protein